MIDDQLDDIFKKRLESHESIVPADMWNRISSKKREKKPAIWWFALAFVFITLATCYLLFINTTNEGAHRNNKNSVQKEKNFGDKKNLEKTTNLPGNLNKPG